MTVTMMTVALMKSYRCDYKGQADHKSDNWTFKYTDFTFSCLLIFYSNGIFSHDANHLAFVSAYIHPLRRSAHRFI
jgi:hypothetical protein